MARLKGISDKMAKISIRSTYLRRFLVWKYPSTIRNAKIGKARRPTQVSQSLPGTMVPHKWSQSMNAIAMMCKDMEVVSIFNRFTGIPPISFFCIINRIGEVVKKIFSNFEMSFENCVFVNNLTINVK